MRGAQLISIVSSLVLARLYGRRTPLFVSWQLTNRCNLKCKYCDYWRYPDEKELSSQEVFSAIDELAGAGTVAISFTGGEPLLREDIGSIVDHAASKGIATKINTNGLLIAKKISELTHVEQVNLSFDGPEDIHDRIRGEASYRAVFEAVSLLKKGRKKIAFHVVLSRYNISAIDFILEKCREVGVGAFFQPATELYLLTKNANPHASEKDAFDSAMQALLRRKKKGERLILNSVSGLSYLASWPSPQKIFCAAGKVMFRINSRGEFYHCERFSAITNTRCLREGVKKALQTASFKGCNECWCAPLVELNLLLQGKIDVMANCLNYL